MDMAVIIAVISSAAAILGIALTSFFTHRGQRSAQLRTAKIAVYGECTEMLYEFERATYNRVKQRLAGRGQDHEELRQQAYKISSKARAAIGKLVVLSDDEELAERLEKARTAIGDLNKSEDADQLLLGHEEVDRQLASALKQARSSIR